MNSGELRAVLGAFPTGVAVVTTVDRKGSRVGLTVNSFASLSLDPPLISWALRAQSPSLTTFQSCGRFIVNILSAEQQALSTRFASPVADKFSGVPVRSSACDLPLIERCSAYLQCLVERSISIGDHVLFVGKVFAAESSSRAPLGVCRGRYFVPEL